MDRVCKYRPFNSSIVINSYLDFYNDVLLMATATLTWLRGIPITTTRISPRTSHAAAFDGIHCNHSNRFVLDSALYRFLRIWLDICFWRTITGTFYKEQPFQIVLNQQGRLLNDLWKISLLPSTALNRGQGYY